jgi:hypothetical protein
MKKYFIASVVAVMAFAFAAFAASLHTYVILLKGDGSELARGMGEAGTYPQPIDPDKNRYRFDFSNVHPAQVQGIRIGIDQGHAFYSYGD